MDLAASAGLYLDPWQAFALTEALGEGEDRKWSALEVGLLVPRQNGKGSILEARELAGLYLLEERLILHSAHEFKTAQEAFLRILFLIENTPDLDKRVLRVRRAHGDEGIELRGGARLRFVARSGGSGRGFTGDCVILDEAFNLAAGALSALLPTLSARPNPQVWYTSSAPLLDPVSDTLRRLRRRGFAGDKRLCFMEWSCLEAADYDDSSVAEANPGLGRRISMEFINEVERGSMPPEDFARERLGVAPDPDSTPSVIPMADWYACVDSDSHVPGAPVIAVDVTPDRSYTSVAFAGIRSDLLPHFEIRDHDAGTAWVAAKLATYKRLKPRFVADLSGPAGSLESECKAVGVALEPVSAKEHAQACGLLLDLTTDHRMRHMGDPLLDAALAGAVKRDAGDGAWLWSRKNSQVDISPLVAATLAVWAATATPPPVRSGFISLDDYLED